MNKLMVFVVLFVAIASSASAACVGNVQVHTVDSTNHDLSGVVVAPEWKFVSTGWNDFFPKEKTTDSNGLANDCLWNAVNTETLEVNYATITGYTCTHGAATLISATNGQNTLQVVCTPNNQVPEFGIVAGAVALVGLVAGVVIMRKRQ